MLCRDVVAAARLVKQRGTSCKTRGRLLLLGPWSVVSKDLLLKKSTKMISKLVPIALLLLLSLLNGANGFHIVLAGGTGQIGRELSSKLVSDGHEITILCRNAFLAAAPSRVSSDFGWLGKSFLEKYPGVKLRDWDGGDLLDIVGQE
jgi:hypothetical protein